RRSGRCLRWQRRGGEVHRQDRGGDGGAKGPESARHSAVSYELRPPDASFVGAGLHTRPEKTMFRTITTSMLALAVLAAPALAQQAPDGAATFTRACASCHREGQT